MTETVGLAQNQTFILVMFESFIVRFLLFPFSFIVIENLFFTQTQRKMSRNEDD